MAFTNEKLQPSNGLYALLAPVVFKNVRSTSEKISRRKSQLSANGVSGGNKVSTERLFIYCG